MISVWMLRVQRKAQLLNGTFVFCLASSRSSVIVQPHSLSGARFQIVVRLFQFMILLFFFRAEQLSCISVLQFFFFRKSSSSAHKISFFCLDFLSFYVLPATIICMTAHLVVSFHFVLTISIRIPAILFSLSLISLFFGTISLFCSDFQKERFLLFYFFLCFSSSLFSLLQLVRMTGAHCRFALVISFSDSAHSQFLRETTCSYFSFSVERLMRLLPPSLSYLLFCFLDYTIVEYSWLFCTTIEQRLVTEGGKTSCICFVSEFVAAWNLQYTNARISQPVRIDYCFRTWRT